MLVLAFLLRGCAADDLFALLTSAPFLHAGTTTSASAYALIGRPCSYLEPENVTVAPAQGIGWTEGGSCPLLYACGGANCSGACEIAPAHPDFDRAGGDYRAFQLPQTPLGAACAAQCCAEVSCAAWAYTDAAPAGQAPSCAAGAPCCYLKAAVHPETPAPGVVCGVVERAPAPGLTAPPMGLRSAAPLGGVGAGALELRGDGSVHEVTIVNQSPAGAAKFGVLEDFLLGARVGGVARALRTAPPAYAAPGVASLTYSALYPLARLAVGEGEFGSLAAPAPQLFAFSRLVAGDPVASAAPAVTFTLAVVNAGAAPLNASLYLALPLASVNDCARPSAAPLVANVSGLDAPACLAACAAAPACASWTLTPPAGALPAQCRLARDAPLSVHAAGAACGLRGAWASDGSALTLTMPCTVASPACGDATLRPVPPDAGDATWSASAGAAADPGQLWRSFAAGGALAGGPFSGAAVGYGAAAVSVTVPPFANATLSIVFAWHFPARDHAGEDIGNFYATLWQDSAVVARELSAPGQVARTVGALLAHHSVFVGAGSSLPDWLADFLVNAMSHFRGMIWSRDGRMREFEAFDW
jgi:hypothetical protein